MLQLTQEMVFQLRTVLDRAIAPAGEIIPQAACKSYGLAIGAYASPIVRLLIFVVYVIAKPISMVLDWALGEDHSVWSAQLPLSPSCPAPVVIAFSLRLSFS